MADVNVAPAAQACINPGGRTPLQHLRACAKCGKEHPATPEFFAIRDKSRGTIKRVCLVCDRARRSAAYLLNREAEMAARKAWYVANKEKILEACRSKHQANPEVARERAKAWRLANQERHRAYSASWAAANVEKKAESDKAWRDKNRIKWRINAKNYMRLKKSTDPGFRLQANIRCAIYKSLQATQDPKNGRSWEKLVGYTAGQLRVHLEKQFTKGMTWENVGQWHVDHVVPLASFEIRSAACADFKAAWALSNLRPLWAEENRRKSDKRLHLL